MNAAKLAFISLALLSCSGLISATIALLLGLGLSLLLGNPYVTATSSWSKKLLQFAIVALGFGLNIETVLQNGRQSLSYTIVTIGLSIVLGILLGNIFRVGKNLSLLLSFGTAICGGSAIAALAPAIKAKQQDIAIALATIFTLNAVALIVFPIIGHALGLDQQAFGLWAALAIHDTSSVIGAAASYGPAALEIATTAKLTRALWIMPCVLIFNIFNNAKGKVTVPFFIIGFIFASALASLFPQHVALWNLNAQIGKQLLTLTLFLIGASLTRQAVAQVGIRSFLQAVTLWIIVSLATLLAILGGLISH